jgi:hypothetical protein
MKCGVLPGFVAAAILVQLGCKPEPPVDPCAPKTILPPATQVGANTLGCLINGQVWVAHTCDPNLTSVHADWSQDGFTLSGARKNGAGTTQILSFTIDSMNHIGSYTIGPMASTGWARFTNYSANCYYSSDSAATGGELMLTKLDRTNYIISGTFEAILYSPTCGDTLRVTDGRFDVRE